MQVLWSRTFDPGCRIDVERFVEDRGLRERTECVHERWAWSLSALNDSDDRPKQVFHDEGAIERLDGHGQPPLSKSRPQSLPKGVGCQYRPQVGHASKSKRRYCGFPVEILPSVLGPRMARLKVPALWIAHKREILVRSARADTLSWRVRSTSAGSRQRVAW